MSKRHSTIRYEIIIIYYTLEVLSVKSYPLKYVLFFIQYSNGKMGDTTDLNVDNYNVCNRTSFCSTSVSLHDRRSSLSSSKKNEIALAKVSLAIVLIFILCHSVRWIPNVYELVRIVRGQKEDWPSWIESLTHISHFLTTLNSSVNFYIYCFKHFSKSSSRSTENNRCCKILSKISCCQRNSESISVV